VNLRTLEKKLSKSKRKRGHKLQRYRVKVRVLPENRVGAVQQYRIAQKRGPYFRTFRKERELLKVLSNFPPDLNEKEERTIVRRVYYRTLPLLFSRLGFWKDRLILQDIERYYYGFLTTVKLLSNEAPSRISRLNWELRHYTSAERVSLSKRSSIEPTSRNGSIVLASAAPPTQ